MNIGLSTSVVQRGKTGVGQYIFALIKAYLEIDTPHQLTLFVLEQDLPLFEFARSKATLIPVSERFRSPVRDILWHQFVLPRLVRQHRIDVLHVPSYRRMLWAHPCPTVATIHDLAPLKIKGKYDWMRTFYAKCVVKQLARRQDQIIAVSQCTAGDIRQFFGLPDSQMTVVHNGVDHSRYSTARIASARVLISQRYGLNDPFFLFVSRLEHPAKNHVRLIQAFEQFKQQSSPWQLVFAGSDWTGAEAIHAAIQRSPCKDSIHNLGFVPDAVLPDLMRAADVFVYPSLYEGFGLPIAEAMACGCPVICSDRSSMLEVAGEAAATMDPENVVALKEQLHRLANDPQLREDLASAGVQRARMFDWKHTAEASFKVYETALRQRPLLTSEELVLSRK